jgi:hypothetical protein
MIPIKPLAKQGWNGTPEQSTSICFGLDWLLVDLNKQKLGYH